MTRGSTEPEIALDDDAESASDEVGPPPRDLADADAFVQRVRALRAAAKRRDADPVQGAGGSAARYADPRPAPKPSEDTPHDAKVLVALSPDQAALREREQQARRVPTGPRLLAVKPRAAGAPGARRPIPKMHFVLGLTVALAVGVLLAVVVARAVSGAPAASRAATATAPSHR